MPTKKTWAEKLASDKAPQLKRIDIDFADIPAGSNMFIATPQMIDSYVRQIPKGQKTSPQTMRKDLALDNKADHTCPVTTGIFLRIVAEANYERYQQTKSLKNIAPFWRIIEPNSALAKKLSFGQDFIVAQRHAEKILA
jgi:hypothetical protein